MKDVYMQEVIICHMGRRGNGTPIDPVRAITEVFTKDGELIADHDPSPSTFVAFDLVHFANHLAKKRGYTADATIKDVEGWLEEIAAKCK